MHPLALSRGPKTLSNEKTQNLRPEFALPPALSPLSSLCQLERLFCPGALEEKVGWCQAKARLNRVPRYAKRNSSFPGL